MKLTSLFCLTLASVMSVAGQDSLTWNLSGNAGQGLFGNTLNFTEDGISVSATGWGYTKGSSDNAFETGGLGQWSLGLGVANRNEGNYPGAPEHHVDNYGSNDFVLFVFDTSVQFDNILVQPSGTYDRDASYWVGNIDPTLSLANLTYNDLASLGFASRVDVNNSRSSSGIAIPIADEGYYNAILFGTKLGTPSSSHDVDRFKIQKITATPIPEPGAALLIGCSGLLFAMRRRRFRA